MPFCVYFMLTMTSESQIAYTGSPLLVPTWAIVNVAISLVIWIWIVATVLYYSNAWFTAYLPFQSSSGMTPLPLVWKQSNKR